MLRIAGSLSPDVWVTWLAGYFESVEGTHCRIGEGRGLCIDEETTAYGPLAAGPHLGRKAKKAVILLPVRVAVSLNLGRKLSFAWFRNATR